MDYDKLLNYLERKTADTHELQAASAIIELRQRVAELEKERDYFKSGIPTRLKHASELETKDDWRHAAMYYESSWSRCSHDFNRVAGELKKKIGELTAERDKANQYWQIAEGRCDALIKQRDELVKAIAIAEPVMDAHAGPSRLADFHAAIASVKEKQNEN